MSSRPAQATQGEMVLQMTWTDEMAQKIKALAVQPGSLSSSPRKYTVKEETRLARVVL